MKKIFTLLTAFILSSCQLVNDNFYEEFLVFVIAGQSNTNSGKGFDSKLDQPDSNILQLGRNFPYDYLIIPAKEPLQHHTSNKSQIGFGLTFAKLYNDSLNPEKKPILIIPCGYGGTSLQNDWTFDGKLYTDMIERVEQTLQKFPNSTIKGLLWHQGESDTGNSNYSTLLDDFILQTRKDLGINMPFIVGGMVPYWVNQDPNRITQQNIIKNTPNRIDNVGYADPEEPFIITKNDDLIDEIHYDAPGQRELAKRYFTAYLNLTQ